MTSIQNVWRAIALALTTLILASCVVEVEEVPPTRPGICTREYAPVCATRGTREKTFGNACEARQSGWNIIGRGECRGIIIDPPRPALNLCFARKSINRFAPHAATASRLSAIPARPTLLAGA